MIQFNTQAPAEPPLLRIEPFKGMNVGVTPTQIDQSQSPEMLNMNIDERGALNKRTGYERVFPTSLGSGPVNGLYEFVKTDGTAIFLMAHGTKLYKQSGNNQPIVIYDKLANNRVDFFTMNDKCYVLDGKDLLQYDGTNFLPIDPYIPTMFISKDPTGGGTFHEDFNLLGTDFRESFSGNGEDKRFFLSQKGLVSEYIRVQVDGKNIPDTGAFNYNPGQGFIDFNTAPPKGTNNVIITARKPATDMPNKIKKCRFHTFFGGANDSRVFLAGNPDMPDVMFRSGLYDVTYWPENGFYKSKEKIMGFAKQYDSLIVERTGGKHQVTYQIDSDGYPTFPSKPLNDTIGTMAGQSIQIVENNPVSLSKDGVFMLTSSTVRDERNVSHISANIDDRLLKEPNLDRAVSVDFDKKYWLALNGNVYMFDYAQRSETNPYGEWFIYDNIPASCFLELNGQLYFGSSKEGLLYRFKKHSDPRPYNDDGQAIKAVWKSKYFTFGADERKKMISKVFYSLKPMGRGGADIYYRSDKKTSNLLKSTKIGVLDFNNIDFRNFSFVFASFPAEKAIKVKAKKVTHFQLIFENNYLDEGLGILSLGIKYSYQSEVK
ncbi:hypothetical protein [Bacillus testis]|uniref:hypothetical protein n=1 Tax=Bacillus testis TaxID=1622072 RepID=UPI00067E918D|nr:hypothetical protein [Bacillus testis]